MKPTRTLLRGLHLLEILGQSDEWMRVTDLAERADLDKATTTRLLHTLVIAGYVRQDPDEKTYHLTANVLRLSQGFRAQLDLKAVAEKQLAALRDEVNESVHLGVREDSHVVYIDKLDSTRSIRLVSAIGQRMPLHTTALGKAILSVTPEEQRQQLLKTMDLVPRTPQSITSVEALRAQLEVTAACGFAVDDRENEDNVTCVAAPIFGPRGQVVGAVSVSGPTFRMEGRLDEIAERCCRTAREITEELGGSADSPELTTDRIIES